MTQKKGKVQRKLTVC